MRNTVTLTRDEGLIGSDFARDVMTHVGRELAFYDAAAATLTPEQVSKALTGRKTIQGIAARLAVECGAFGYGPGDYLKAQTAFRKLPTERV